MRVLEPVEHPADRTTASWVFDVFVAVFAAVAGVPFLFHDHSHPGAAAVAVLVVVVGLPLSLRRSWPLAVFGWVFVTAGVARVWDHHLVAGLAILIALYTVASLQSRRETLICTGLVELTIIGASIVVARGDWWFALIFLTGLLSAAVGLGLYTGTRRAYLLELRDRADRLEREKAQEGALAAAGERARIAREMHDIVAHHLTVMVALSDGAIAASAKSPERGVEVMRTVSATGRRALAETRRLIGVLRTDVDPGADAEEAVGVEEGPELLQPVPDLAELDELLNRVRSAGLPTTLEVHGAAGDLPAGVQLTVYRLVQEALTNTLKHGGPDARAEVRLTHLPGELRVEIDDDGAGATAVVPVGVGSGLAGMRERVHIVGGDLASGPREHGGWRVTARIALDGADA